MSKIGNFIKSTALSIAILANTLFENDDKKPQEKPEPKQRTLDKDEMAATQPSDTVVVQGKPVATIKTPANK